MEVTRLSRSARIASGITLGLWLTASYGVMEGWYPEWNWRAQVFSTMLVLPFTIFAIFTFLSDRNVRVRMKKIVQVVCFVNIPFTICILMLPFYMVFPLRSDNLLILQNGSAQVVQDAIFLWAPNVEGIYYSTQTAAAEDVQIFATFTPNAEMLPLVYDYYRTPENYYAACRNEFHRRLDLAKATASDPTSRACVQCAFSNVPWNANDSVVKYSRIQVSFKKPNRA